MKKYILIGAILFAIFLVNLDAVSFEPTPVVVRPSTIGPNSLVDAIKEYSDLTSYDVAKWKLVKLGVLDYWVALGLGVYSMGLAAQAATKSFDYVSKNVPQFIADNIALPDVLKKKEHWAVAGAAGAGLLSYNILYTRIRAGMLNKVKKFINVCAGLTVANSYASTNMQQMFPVEWNTGGDAARCKALNNLVMQGQAAVALLNHIGYDDSQVSSMAPLVNEYFRYLQYNQMQFKQYCNQLVASEEEEEDKAVHRAGMRAHVFGQQLQNVNTTLSIVKKIGNFLYRGAKDMVSWSVENPAPAGLLGMAYYFWKNSNFTNVGQTVPATTTNVSTSDTSK